MAETSLEKLEKGLEINNPQSVEGKDVQAVISSKETLVGDVNKAKRYELSKKITAYLKTNKDALLLQQKGDVISQLSVLQASLDQINGTEMTTGETLASYVGAPRVGYAIEQATKGTLTAANNLSADMIEGAKQNPAMRVLVTALTAVGAVWLFKKVKSLTWDLAFRKKDSTGNTMRDSKGNDVTKTTWTGKGIFTALVGIGGFLGIQKLAEAANRDSIDPSKKEMEQVGKDPDVSQVAWTGNTLRFPKVPNRVWFVVEKGLDGKETPKEATTEQYQLQNPASKEVQVFHQLYTPLATDKGGYCATNKVKFNKQPAGPAEKKTEPK